MNEGTYFVQLPQISAYIHKTHIINFWILTDNDEPDVRRELFLDDCYSGADLVRRKQVQGVWLHVYLSNVNRNEELWVTIEWQVKINKKFLASSVLNSQHGNLSFLF
jgi:hypothetical protein